MCPSSIANGLENTGVVAGSYVNANVTVDAQGRITFAEDGAAQGVTQLVAGDGLTGGTITTTGTIALSDTGVAVGTYTNAEITVDAERFVASAATGSGGGGSPALVFVPAKLDFAPGANALTTSLVNVGGSVASGVTLSATNVFGLTTDCPSTLAAGTACTATFTLPPPGAPAVVSGAGSASSSNAPAALVPLSGTR